MHVRITAHINGDLGPDQYSYYPGQVIVDHPHEEEWLSRRQAVPVNGVEVATLPPAETADAPTAESTVQPVQEIRVFKNRRK